MADGRVAAMADGRVAVIAGQFIYRRRARV